MAVGDTMPVFAGMQTTYKEDFSNGLGLFVEDKHIWNRETVINDEGQYYPDQSVLQSQDRTVFINGQGNLVLRTIPTPGYLSDANVVLNSYQITNAISSTQVEVAGLNHYDQTIQQSITGIGPRRDNSGTVRINNQNIGYSSIVDISSGANSRHLITLTSPVNGLTTSSRVTVLRRQPYVSGIVTTQNTQANGNSGFSQKFGRFGARIKCARGLGHFPAFWLWPDYEEINGITYSSIDKQCEKDVWEILGHSPNISYQTLHQPGFDMRPNGSPFSGQYNGVDQWKNSFFQQFQLLAFRDHSAEFLWVYLDWYTDNTFAWFIENGQNSGNFIEVANSRGAPPYVNGVIDESMLIFNNAFGSNWSFDQAQIDVNWPGYTGTTSFPLDFEISDVCVEQWSGQQIGSGDVSTGTGPTTFTDQTVIGPFGDFSDVVVCLPNEETDRQGTIHEIEAKIAFRPYNIPESSIGIQWFHNFPPPFNVTFVDGSDKQFRARIHLTTTGNAPLPSTLQGNVFCQIFEII